MRVTRNGKKFEDPSETPEEIVGLIGNIGNRPDIREVQKRQVEEIKRLVAEARNEGWHDGYHSGSGVNE